MSYTTALAAIHAVIEDVTGITSTLVGEPRVVQMAPFVYSELETFDSEELNDIKKFTYRTLHRLCLLWQDPHEAEEQLAGFVNTIPAAVDADSSLGGAVRNAEIRNGEANWAEIVGVEYRIMDFHSEILEWLPYGR